MPQHKNLRWISGALLLLAVITLSCQFGAQTASRQVTQGNQAVQAARPTETQPAQPPTALPTPTTAPATPTATVTATSAPKALQSLAAEKIDTTSITGGADGKAQFTDKVSGVQMAVTVENSDSHQPVDKVSLWFASRGPEVLVLALDPAGNYVPAQQTLEAQAAQDAQLSAKISLVPLTTAVKSPQDWAAYLKALPDLSAWETGAQEICAPPDQLMSKLPFQADGLLLGRPDDNIIADLARNTYYIAVGAQGFLTSPFPIKVPAIPRWKISRIGTNGPAMATPIGFCLWPLDRNSAESIATWVNYGLQKKDLYPFTQLTNTGGVNYANSQEGVQPNLAGDYLSELNKRLVNGAQCDGYGIASDYLQVWTSGWNPPWVISLMCYMDGCKPVTPLATSDVAAFFFVKGNDGWTMNTVWQNKPDIWKDVYQLSLTDCLPIEAASQPPPESTATPTAAP